MISGKILDEKMQFYLPGDKYVGKIANYDFSLDSRFEDWLDQMKEKYRLKHCVVTIRTLHNSHKKNFGTVEAEEKRELVFQS